MKIVAMLLLAFMLGPLAQPQTAAQTPPTVEQCTADLHGWYPNRQKDSQKLSASDLETRLAEVLACSGMASSGFPQYKMLADDAIEYETLANTYDESFTHRLVHFIQRHGQLAEFVKEDKSGQR